mmetsp:Transcript_70871/g.196893  ORF Transcript_70871/g.196893 Transcript_70871/m.196893 type:complete len:252 (+) Transcript_70871:748-1503(+)
MEAPVSSKGISLCTFFAGTPSSSSWPPPHNGYMTSSVFASSSTKDTIARLARSSFKTRTALPQDSGAEASMGAFCEDMPQSMRVTDVSPSGLGISSAQPSSSPMLSCWIISWNRSQAAALLESSGSALSTRAASRISMARSASTPFAGRFPSSRIKPCLWFSSKTFEPSSASTTRPTDSDDRPSPNPTRATWPSSATWSRRLSGSSSLRTSSFDLPDSKSLLASTLVQLINSVPWNSFRNCVAYSSTGSNM